jgi:hypothetical protein
VVGKLVVTIAALAFAIGAFCGTGPTTISPSPFGFLFLGIAALVWFVWKPTSEGFNRPGIWDSITKGWRGLRDADAHRKSSG